jgi:hypothetical protein
MNSAIEKKPFPLDEHVLIGLELCAMRERLKILATRIADRYSEEIGRSCRKAADAVDLFREVMNEQVRQSCPAQYAGKVVGIYYCTERLSALREEGAIQLIGARILGIASSDCPPS